MSASGPFLIKRSVTLNGHRTSVALEPVFWEELDALAVRAQLSKASLIAEVDRKRHPDQSLASALRVFVLSEARDQKA